MGSENVPLIAFNRGYISPLGLARVDIKRTAMSAEEQNNWMPRVLGSMMLRPGLEYLNATKNNLTAVHTPFIFSNSDLAILQFTNQVMRVLVDDTPVTRPSVSTVVTNGDFSSGTGWTDADESGAASTITGGKLELVGTGFAAAIRRREVTVAVGDQNIEHALRIIVERGPVTLRVGSTSGDDDYITETTLGTGEHSLALTPTGNFWVQLQSTAQAKKIVDSIQVEAAGIMELPTPYIEADLRKIRTDQSADVVYLACNGYQQRKIERRATRSWSFVKYEPLDGPFRSVNLSQISLTPSALTGDITLTASRSLFKSTHVGALFRLTSIGQRIETSFTAENQFSNEIRITGVGSSQRSFTITRSGTWSATLTLQRSVGEPGSWVDVTTYTTNATTTYNDGLDNQIVYYRIGIKTGNYTSGTAVTELSYANGGLTGVVKITGYSSATSVSAAVITPLGATTATTDWSEGEWSDRRGYPSAVALHQGRLWWAGKSKIWASVSDAYESFDDEVEGDSGPISRAIGSGPVDGINWLLRLKRLIVGTAGAEWTVQASSLDEPLTPSNFGFDDPSTQGSSNVAAVKLDDRGLFVQKSGSKLYQILTDAESSYGNYKSVDLNELSPEIGRPGMVRLAVQRQPDTRVHCVRSDGKVAVLVSQPAEEVMCWVLVETDGLVEDAFVLPGNEEDAVYYLVKRTINGSTVRYLEKWALESECQGGAANKQADSFLHYDDVATDTIDGLGHLEGEEVVVWGDGKDLGTYTVSGGEITLSEEVEEAIVGLAYEARFKSAKLAHAAVMGTALTMRKKISDIGLILANTHYQGLQYGPSFDLLDDLPLVEDGAVTPADTVWEAFDSDKISFNGEWSTDSRICLKAAAPRPCTVLAGIIGMTTNG